MKLFLVALAIFFTNELHAKQQIDFSNLKEGESIRLTFESFGCFHGYIKTISFSKKSATLFKADPKTSTPQFIKYIPVETLSLDKSDLKKLDALLHFYRTNRDSGCTTVDKISIDLIKDDHVIRQEKYTDESCATDEQKDLLSIPNFLTRFKAEQDAAANP